MALLSLVVRKPNKKGLSMSSNLAQVLGSLKSEIKIDSNGRGFVTVSVAARLCGVSQQTLQEAFSSHRILNSKLAQSLINKGFDPTAFNKNGLPDTALACILEYYTFDAGKRCTETAELAFRAFLAIGVRTWLQKSVGYVEPEQPVFDNPKSKKASNVLTDEEKLAKIHEYLLKYCKGEPRTTGYFGSGHSFVRRLDVLALFGKKGQKYLNKPQIIKLFRSAEAAGFGSLKVNGKQIYTFTPFNNLKLLTA